MSKLIISENDSRKYRQITLPNGLEALLIHDNESDKAGAALSVNVGYWADPDQTEGLAHFCEHLLFLGTKKYPEEGSYNAFLESHGGKYNGYTSAETTTYLFEVGYEHLDKSLDMFSRFFIDPLFTASGVDREVQAVNSEHEKNLQNDMWRTHQLNNVIANKKHPMSKFGTGSSKTLQIHSDLRDQVIKFWEQHYSANIMKLIILGRESLDDLENMARTKFSEVENKHVKVEIPTVPPFEKHQLTTRLEANSVSESHRLVLAWILPETRSFFREKPDGYLSHLIGHEGQGSILSYLKAKGWGDALLAGPMQLPDHSQFHVAVELTESGLKHVNEITDVIYAYIGLILDHGIKPDLYEECKVLGQLSFRFQDKQSPFSYVSSVVGNMINYPPDLVLVGPKLYDRYDEQLIRRIASHMTPSNMNMAVFDPPEEREAFSSDASANGDTESGNVKRKRGYMEVNYQIPYDLNPIESSVVSRWERLLKQSPKDIASEFPGLAILQPNIFMPDDLEILKNNEGLSPDDADYDNDRIYPKIVVDTPTMRIWHKLDKKYNKPKANLFFEFTAPASYYTPYHSVRSKIFTEYVIDDLNEFAYDAQVAGLKYVLTNTVGGFSLAISGYSCKQSLLLEKLLERFTNIKFNQERFDLVKNCILRNYLNTEFEQPYTLANYHMSLSLEYPRWYYRQYIDIIKNDITMESVSGFASEWLQLLFVEGLANGNILDTQVQKIASFIETTLHPKPVYSGLYQLSRLVQLPRNPLKQHWVQIVAPNPQESNFAIYNTLQVDITNTKQRVTLEVLMQLAGPWFFDSLRTNEQLGYVVSAFTRSHCSVDGVNFVIQSVKADPVVLDAKIDEWIEKTGQRLKSVSDEEFEQNRKGAIAEKLERFNSLKQESLYFWKYISAPHTYEFDSRFKEAGVLEKITKQDLVDLWYEYVDVKAPKRAKISCQLWSRSKAPYVPEQTNGMEITLIADALTFKTNMPLFGTIPMGKDRIRPSGSSNVPKAAKSDASLDV